MTQCPGAKQVLLNQMLGTLDTGIRRTFCLKIDSNESQALDSANRLLIVTQSISENHSRQIIIFRTAETFQSYISTQKLSRSNFGSFD